MSRFIDEATIEVIAGKGGPGSVSFRRETFAPRGGPNGGDGGKGGDVWLVANHNLNTLMDLRYKKKYKAPNGNHGSGSNKAGSDGDDIEIFLPIGSIITDAQTDEEICEIKTVHDRFLLAEGGRGGKGNTFFKSSTHQAPKFAQPGEEGESRTVKIELKLLADVGIVGYPNAGKSSFISRVSAARPKVASYAFTTMTPNLGVVKLNNEKSSPTFIIADVPGLIEGASLGRGLGIQFLRHLEKTSLLIHLVDGAKLLKEFSLPGKKLDAKKIAKGFVRDKEIIDAELYTFDAELAAKAQILALNKCDLFEEDFLKKIKKELEKLGFEQVHLISTAAQTGLSPVLSEVVEKLKPFKESLEEGKISPVKLPHEVSAP